MYSWAILKLLIYLNSFFKKVVCLEGEENEEFLTPYRTAIILKLTGKPLKDQYDYKLTGNTGTYTPKEKFGFSSIIIPTSCSKSEAPIWESQHREEYATEAVVFKEDSNPEYIKLKLVNGETKQLLRENSGTWREFNHDSKIKTSLHINILYQPYTYYFFDGNIRIYKPKEYCTYSEVKQITKTKTHTLWKSKNENEFVNKIAANGAFDTETTNKVSIFLNNDILHYIKRENVWILTTNQICVNILKKNSTFEFIYNKNKEFEIYKPRYDFVFAKIIIGNSTIWKSNNENELIKKVLLDVEPNKYIPKSILLFLKNKFVKHFILFDSGWTEIKPLITLNINRKENNPSYKYFKNNNGIEYFIPNGNILFKGVNCTEGLITQVNVDIWCSKKSNQYAKSVIIIPSAKEKFLIILLINNHYLIYIKSDIITTWTNQTHNPYALGELKLLGFDLTKLKPYPKDKPPSKVEPEPEKIPETIPLSDLKSKNLIDLDISKMFNIFGYEIKYSDNKIIYKTNYHYLFNSVKNNDEILWQSKNNNEYPNKVIYKLENNEPKIKVYFPEDESTQKRKPNPMIQFNPSDLNVQIINYNIDDEDIKNKLSHKPNTRFSWKTGIPRTELRLKPP